MASLVTTKTGTREIHFRGVDEKRRTLRLGEMPIKAAQSVLHHVESILGAQAAKASVPFATASWLGELPDALHDRLTRCGLAESQKPHSDSPTLANWSSKFLEQRAASGMAEGSIIRLRQSIDRLIARFGNDTPLDEITPDGAADWRAAMLGEGLAEATVRLHCRNAKTLLNEAVERELTSRNPFKKLKSGAVAAQRERYVTPEETVRLMDAASFPWRVLIGLTRLAGVRCPSESHTLKWDDVNWERRQLRVHAPKTGATRFVPIAPELFDLLREAFEAAEVGAEYVVTVSKSRGNIHRKLRRIAAQAGLEEWPDLMQTLRRSCESQLALTHPQHAVSRWIGHSMQVSERYYLPQTDEMVQRAASTSLLPRDLPWKQTDVKSDVEHVRTGSHRGEILVDGEGEVEGATERHNPACCRSLRRHAGLCVQWTGAGSNRRHQDFQSVIPFRRNSIKRLQNKRFRQLRGHLKTTARSEMRSGLTTHRQLSRTAQSRHQPSSPRSPRQFASPLKRSSLI